MAPKESSVTTRAAASLAVLGVLLICGHVLRAKIKLLRVLFFPASLIGGFLGMVLFKLIELNDGASTPF